MLTFSNIAFKVLWKCRECENTRSLTQQRCNPQFIDVKAEPRMLEVFSVCLIQCTITLIAVCLLVLLTQS